jgi:hypothetical protein
VSVTPPPFPAIVARAGESESPSTVTGTLAVSVRPPETTAALTVAWPGASPVTSPLVSTETAVVDAPSTVARTARPHLLSDYLFELATTFSTFYAENPVLKAEPEVRAARLALCDLTAKTIRSGLGLLGIDVIDRM